VSRTDSPTIARRRIGQVLKELREAAGKSHVDAAQILEIDRTGIGRIEAGKGRLRVRDLHALLDLYGVDQPDLRTELVALAQVGGTRGWWSGMAGSMGRTYAAYVGFEAGATELLNFEAIAVPGLLQTEAYATALLRTTVPRLTPDEVTRRVGIRMRRQDRVRDGALAVHAIVDESLLHRRIGGDEIWMAQLSRLASDAARDNITVQILPFDTPAHPGALGSFVILNFADDPTLAYVESLAGDLMVDGGQAANFKETFHQLAVAALPAEMSRRRILAAAERGAHEAH
jgi:hypothetical protein